MVKIYDVKAMINTQFEVSVMTLDCKDVIGSFQTGKQISSD